MSTNHDTTGPEEIAAIEKHIYGGKPGVTRKAVDDILFLLAHIRTLERENREMGALLTRAIKKLRIYHAQTGGEYGGGEPLDMLTNDIDKVLSSIPSR